MDEQLRWMDATEQADLVRSGQVSAAELLAEARERIREFNPAVNAVIAELDGTSPVASTPDDATEALAADELPFPGVPFLVKDLALEIAGTPFSEGSRWLAGSHSTTRSSRGASAGPGWPSSARPTPASSA
ncbi:hypothetical protein ACFVTM_14155 [Arthrobacter sp. NPDC058130]|uniref:hypothetical protein n=1 Tax=Arthrobacter sp. NPDC058130 TaxID=3346353 RepID=UPI0036E588BE